MTEPHQEVLNTLNDGLHKAMTARESLNNVLLGQGHIVVIQEPDSTLLFALAFKTNEARIIIGTEIVPLMNAPRFTKEDATNLCINAKIQNGKGTPAKAIHIKDALDIDIENFNTSIAWVKSRIEAVEKEASDA